MPKIRNIIIFVVIAGVLVIIYIFLIKGPSAPAGLVSTPAALPNMDGSTPTDLANIQNSNSAIAKDFLALLLNVKNIKLDDSIFTDPAFTSLHDSAIVLVPDLVTGRPNPFALFGSDAEIAGNTPPSANPQTDSSSSTSLPSLPPLPITTPTKTKTPTTTKP